MENQKGQVRLFDDSHRTHSSPTHVPLIQHRALSLLQLDTPRGCSSECFVAQRNVNLIIIHPRSSKQVGRVIASAIIIICLLYKSYKLFLALHFKLMHSLE